MSKVSWAVFAGVASLGLAACGAPLDASRLGPFAAVHIASERGLPDSYGRFERWGLDREPGFSASFVELRGAGPGLGRNTQARTRLLVLEGTLRVRVGDEERLLRPGAFVSIPRGMLSRVSPSSGGKALYLRILTPDMDREEIWEPRVFGAGR